MFEATPKYVPLKYGTIYPSDDLIERCHKLLEGETVKQPTLRTPVKTQVGVAVNGPSADGKVKAAEGKVPFALLPLRALEGTTRVFAYGAKKYAPGNHYTANMNDGAGPRYISAAFRHLEAMQCANGLHTRESLSTLDEESGLPHIDHAIASLLMLRGIMTKNQYLPADPGVGKEPK